MLTPSPSAGCPCSRARSHRPDPTSTAPGQLQQPVAIAGVVVLPGDIVVADADGVVVVQRAEAERVLADAEKIEATEAEKRIAYANGMRP